MGNFPNFVQLHVVWVQAFVFLLPCVLVVTASRKRAMLLSSLSFMHGNTIIIISVPELHNFCLLYLLFLVVTPSLYSHCPFCPCWSLKPSLRSPPALCQCASPGPSPSPVLAFRSTAALPPTAARALTALTKPISLALQEHASNLLLSGRQHTRIFGQIHVPAVPHL